MIRLIGCHDYAAARLVRGQLLTELSNTDGVCVHLGDAAIALAEIITNALEHGGTDVVVECDTTSGHPIVLVHDDGPGLASAVSALEQLAADPGGPSPSGRGMRIAGSLCRELRVIERAGGGLTVRMVLGACADRTRRCAIDAAPENEPSTFAALARITEPADDVMV
ncbi:MAG: ATP-binding protein [Actinomycetota bacterium]